jgi:hypothetical protein
MKKINNIKLTIERKYYMDFSSLVLMEKDKDTGMLTKELASYEVNEGAEYITKMYYSEDEVYVFFDTQRDVEEWEYSAVYDLFNEEVFIENKYDIEFVDEEYNPTWRVKFEYMEDFQLMKDKLNELCGLISEEMELVFEKIKGKEEEYK